MDKNNKQKASYSTWQNIKYVCGGVWKYDRLLFLYCVIFSILSAATPFINIFFPTFIIDELLGAKQPQKILTLLISFFVVSALVGYFSTYLNNLCYARMIKIRCKYMLLHNEKCMATDFQNTEDPNFLNDMQTASRCLYYNDTGIEGLLHKLFNLVGSLIALGGYITIVSSLNIFVLIYLIANVLIEYFLTFSVKNYVHSKKDEISENDRRSEYIYKLMYDFSYGKEIRTYGISNWISNMFKEYKGRRLKTQKQIKYKEFKIGIFDVLLLLIREGIIYAYLIYLVITNRLSIPYFTMYFATIAGFSDHLNGFIYDIADIRAQSLDICDFRNFLERPDVMENKSPVSIPKPPYEIEFKNVSFKYPNGEKYIFKNLNLKIPYGQKLAIVGHNGAGKTTFVKLLCRLYDVCDGEILLNGINIKNFSKTEYYNLFSAVFQEIKPLAFSVAENIGVAEKDELDYERLNASLEQSGMEDKIKTLKKGVDTSMLKILDSEGIEFSGGENQKIMMARALYKNGSIMVLDEPTASLDSLAEYSIYTRFNEMVENKMAVYISHRLASTRFCDMIAMFEQGQLVEYGTHEELMKMNGKYAEMFSIQAKYYEEGEEMTI